MDAIADKTFTTEAPQKAVSVESPSLLTLIIDTNPAQWHTLGDKQALRKVLESLVIVMNMHLAVNNANRVAIIANHSDGAKFIYPSSATSNDHQHHQQKSTTSSSSSSADPENHKDHSTDSRSTTPEEATTTTSTSTAGSKFVKPQMYRQFKVVDEAFLENILKLFEEPTPSKPPRNNLSTSLSLALSYINKTQNVDPSLKARILMVNISPDEHLKYIPIMNCIFAAQKMKVPINVCQLAGDATFLQQAADATSGVYLQIKDLDGLVQYFATAFFIDPSLRNILIKPTSGNIDFRASCFTTGKVVDIGYVCSVCLCILSEVPENEKCPACDSEFDSHVIRKLKRKPVVVGKKKTKKRKLDGSTPTPSTGSTPGTPAFTPAP